MKRAIDWVKSIAAILTIIGVITTIAFEVNAYLKTPSLRYEDNTYYLSGAESLFHVAVTNEGRAAAEDVEVNITANGQIHNAWVKKGLNGAIIDENELFDTSSKIDIGNKSAEVNILYIARGMKYVVGLIIEPNSQSAEPSCQVIINSKNGGVAKRYEDRGGIGLKWLFIGLVLGIVFTIAVFYLYLRIRRFHLQRAEPKINVRPKKRLPKKKEPLQPPINGNS
jgi:hypothetical protein